MEFFADIFVNGTSRKRFQAALSRLKDLLSSLGALNDVATCRALIAPMAGFTRRVPKASGSAQRAFAARVILRAQDAQVVRLLDAAEIAYRRFLDVKPFWA